MTFTPSFFLPLIEATNPPRSNPPPTIAGNALASLPPFTTGLPPFGVNGGFGLTFDLDLGFVLGFAFVGLEPPLLVCGFVGNLLGFVFAGFTYLGFALVCGFLGKTDFTIFLSALTTALSLLVVFFAILIASLTALAPYFTTAFALFAAIALAITVNATLPPIANISGIAMLTSPHFSVWHTSKRPVL